MLNEVSMVVRARLVANKCLFYAMQLLAKAQPGGL